MKKFLLILATCLCALGFQDEAYAKKVEIQSQWKGAKVAFLGDSITEPNQMAHGTNVYWNRLKEILGIEPYCYAVSGHQTKDLMGQLERLQGERGQDIDAIIILIGTNDFNSNVEIGSWYSETMDTTIYNGRSVVRRHRKVVTEGPSTCACINRFMSVVKKEYPTKQVIFLTPTHRAYAWFSDVNIQPDELYSNDLGLFIDDYAAVIGEAAQVWAVPVIDLGADCGLYPLEEKQQIFFGSIKTDMLHPNTNGHARMAYALAYQLLGYPSKF